MAPSKRNGHDDSSTGSKAPTLSAKAIGKKPAAATPNHINNAVVRKEKEDNKDTYAASDPENVSSAELKSLTWATEDLSVLNSYRRKYSLPQQAPYTNSLHQAIFSYGIGRQSPTAVARQIKARKNQTKYTGSKRDLATAVRKHFNAMPADQTTVAASFINRVHETGKEFRMRSSPNKNKSVGT
ncbi:hypothetical protein CAC42_6423 [Sphaceloma murrayae]|uniref:Histone deacetylase complex subunit SAP30 Sin3 binding domain-containing protein n=1 Tax=Sphaceloma murrayae TaxID=2082308 RepID=A0A2K1QMD5_9PEZI|nr:hypothetical protein CAC42_6423 [Sphaceloma murrayae]